MKTLALGAAIIAAASLAGATGAAALGGIKHYNNAKVAGQKWQGNALMASKFCSGKGYKNVYFFNYSHFEQGKYPNWGRHVFSNIQCTNATVS
jgi:hypothetical protein